MQVPWKHNYAYIKAGIAEAVRISKTVTPSPPVVPYTWYRYHAEPAPDPHAGQLLSPQDAKLQFQFPLTLPGVKQLIIWGDEHSNSTKEAALAQWLKSNAAAFKTPETLLFPGTGMDRDIRKGESAALPHYFPKVVAASRPPAKPIARDGPIPPYTSCTL
eukprot:COSAG02_NODE_3739_length_6303_cov_12.797228_6_plen_160_part_00